MGSYNEKQREENEDVRMTEMEPAQKGENKMENREKQRTGKREVSMMRGMTRGK